MEIIVLTASILLVLVNITEARLELVQKKSSTSNVFYKKSGDRVILEFEIYASPKPLVFDLKINDRLILQEYKVTVQHVDKPLKYRVTLMFHDKFSPKMTGTYTLWIDNGMPERLRYIFTLKDKAESLMNTTLYVIIQALLLFIIVAMIVILRIVYKARKRQKSIAAIKAKKQEEEGKGSVVLETDNRPKDIGQLDVIT